MKSRIRNNKTFIRAMTAILAIAMLLPLLLAGRALAAEKECRVRVGAGGTDTEAMLKDAGAVVDLYLLAESKQEGVYDYPGGFPDPEMDQDAWNRITQDEARKRVGSTDPDISGVALGTWTDVGTPGIYLAVMRPGDATDAGYLKEFENSDGDKYLASEILSKDKSIGAKVAPEAIAIPGRKLDADGRPAGWAYSLDVDMKPEVEHRLGSVEIVKDLLTFEKDHKAFFLFQVEGYLDGEHVYSNLVSMRFDNYGEQRVRLDNIPVGTELTVMELYSTPGYYLTGMSPADGKVTVSFDEILEVRFENDYDGTRDKGDGIMNNFDYDMEKNDWSWSQG